MTETNSNLADAIKAIQDTANQACDAKIVDLKCDDGDDGVLNVPVALLPGGNGQVSAIPLLDTLKAGIRTARELRLQYAEGPDRREGCARHQALGSFIQHANRFKADSSAVWANAQHRTLIAVLDYHPEGADSPARWMKHTGKYECPLSEAWVAWGCGNPLNLDQDGFAALLDARDSELTAGKLYNGKEAPDPAALITLASNLEVYSTATAKRERDPNTGRVKISYAEDKGVSGTVMPPPAFLVRIPIFQDSEKTVLEVRLRVTVAEGQAKFTVQIHEAGEVLREAFNELCEQVKDETALPVFVGAPEL